MPELVGVLTPNRQPALTSAKRMARGLDEIRAVDFGYVYKNGKLTDQTGIRFHMNRKRRLADLPIDQRLPNTIDGVEVDVLEVGYTPHQGGPRSPHDPCNTASASELRSDCGRERLDRSCAISMRDSSVC